jgi:hypothetical protein
MHQQVESGVIDRRSSLIATKNNLIKHYRNTVMWAVRALEYKRRFEREDDFDSNDLGDIRGSVRFLEQDSRRELKEIAINVKLLRKQIDDINDELMNISGD